MTGRVLAVTTSLAALAALVTACIYPTDKGDELRIEVASIARLIRGDSVRVQATLLGVDGAPIPNARFAYSSANKSVAVVTSDGLVIAINSGSTNIAVQSVGTERTPVVETRVSVSATVSVDSLRPVAARWGQRLSLYGSGLGPGTDQVVTINDVPVSVESYRAADSLHPERFGVLQVVAAPPLETDRTEANASVLVVTSRGAAALSTPLTIDSVDIFWPNTLTAADLGTITDRSEFSGLALEGPYWIDWYSFNTTTAGDWTVKLENSEGASVTFFPAGGVEAERLQNTPGSVASTYIAYYPGRGSSKGWVTLCEGRGVWRSVPWQPGLFSSGFGASPYSLSITLRNVPAGRHDLILNWGGQEGVASSDSSPRGGPTPKPFPNRRADEWAVVAPPLFEPTRAHRYDLIIEPRTASDLARDVYEPNDFCEDATSPLLTLGSSGFTDSVVNLTFDRPYDTDWFRIVAQTGGLLQMRAPIDTLGYGLSGEMAPSEVDSAVVTGHFSDYDTWCGTGWTDLYLVSYGPDGCEVEGVSLQAGAYHLVLAGYEVAKPYQLRVTWAPGILPVAPRTALGPR